MDMKGESNGLVAHNTPEDFPPSQSPRPFPRPPRTVTLGVFIATLIFFNVVLLGLTLSLGWPPLSPLSSSGNWPYCEPYSDRGLPNSWLPDRLATVEDIGKLVNRPELELNTGFVKAAAAGKETTVRQFSFEITQAYAALDGFYKPMILVNGQSPGPLIEANAWDTVRVHVHNCMVNTSTSIHWHGIDQRNTTWMDGVAGVSQCGIPPGASFTYEFHLLDQRGTFWYHAHMSIQYTDGLYGPVVIHDPDEKVPKTDDERIMFVGDHYHTYGSLLVDSYLCPGSQWSPKEAGVEPLPDNFLINEQHTCNCSVISSTYPPPQPPQSHPSPRSNSSTETRTPPPPPPCTGGRLSATRVQQAKTVRLRLINHSSFMSFWFSVDNHTLTIVEMDGVEVEPLRGQRGVYISIGQRYSVILRADQEAGAYYIRATLPQTCFVPYCPYVSTGLESIGYQARALLVYEANDTTTTTEEENGNSHQEGQEDQEDKKNQHGHPHQHQEPLGVAGNMSNPYGIANNFARGRRVGRVRRHALRSARPCPETSRSGRQSAEHA